ncbi:MAG: histone deacetylase [Cyanobacteria bacterium J06632_22]
MTSAFPVIYSDVFLSHDTGPGHPENAGRLQAVITALRSHPQADRLDWCSPSQRDVADWIKSVHHPQYVQALESFAQRGGGQLDADTIVSPNSYKAAVTAVAAWLDGVDTVLNREAPALALVRPPGHHAEHDRGMGFCLLSNAAIAAHYGLRRPAVQRVAIFDWDVHHGNGTQALVSNNPDIFYCSLHQSPAYPGTGATREVGRHNNILNIPMPPASTWRDYEVPFFEEILPRLQAFSPDLLLVSAGYDANATDPLASIQLVPADYGTMTRACLTITPRTLFGLEGGYDYVSLSQSVIETVLACLNHRNPDGEVLQAG